MREGVALDDVPSTAAGRAAALEEGQRGNTPSGFFLGEGGVRKCV
jgi:hypothetical protein